MNIRITKLQIKQEEREKHDRFIFYKQVSVVNPAMEAALGMVQKFASDVREGKVPENRLSFGAPWRHPPRGGNPDASYKWAKIQLMDFVQSFVNTEFGVIKLFFLLHFLIISSRHRHGTVFESYKFLLFRLHGENNMFFSFYRIYFTAFCIINLLWNSRTSVALMFVFYRWII